MLIQADASQLEWRTAVELSGDNVGLQEIVDGADTHSLNQVAFNLPSRLIAKIYLFRTIFRGSGWSFAHDPDFMHVSSSPEFWENVNEKFYSKYVGLDKKHKEWTKLVVEGKPIVGPLGRMWPIPMAVKPSGEKYIPLTKLVNFPVQGTGADVMALARVSFARRLSAESSLAKAKLVSSVHDSIVVDAEEASLTTISKLFHEVFKDLPLNIKRMFGYEWKTPLACEVKYGMNLKDMEKS